jgi:choline dehydrogenase-like flavoprotein
MRDPIAEGLAAGWNAIDASRLAADVEVDTDVVIVGSGAGGGVCAEIFATAGLGVVLLEEGPLRGTRDFRMRESDAYPDLYQESAARKTKDKAINILQGRCVGGSTTVNWTSSFRTPPATLDFWRERLGLSALTDAELGPWFAAMEDRLGVRAWDVPPNENNEVLRRGAERLAIPVAAIRRNVRGCWNLGYCGTGCPTNAKQSMLVTTIPEALQRGARLYSRTRVQRLMARGERVVGVAAVAMDERGMRPLARRITVHARHVVLAAGAIGSPAILLRSGAPDPHGLLGERTFLHPTVVSAAIMPQRVSGYSGAPQSLYSDHFLEVDPIDGPLGFKLETPPLHPVLFSTTLHGHGDFHAGLMARFAQAHALIALLRDGFHRDSRGGRVLLQSDDTPLLDYPLESLFWDGARRALLAMAEIQFAAGAERVFVVDERCAGYASWREARKQIPALDLKPILTRIVSAHVMGGCAMGADARSGVVDAEGRHHLLEGLSVIDGSVFPTSVGANPQLSVYALAARNASRIAAVLTGRPAPAIPAAAS